MFIYMVRVYSVYVASWIETEYYSIAYFEHITEFDAAELPLRVGLIHAM